MPQHAQLARWWCGVAISLACVAGCQVLRSAAKPPQFVHELRREQLVLHSELPSAERERLIEQLCPQRELLATKLRLPLTEVPIHIYLFSEEADYYSFLADRFPGFPARRAIFVETDIELAVYAHSSQHTLEDLRHEVTHGYLHAALPHLPLWLDEGLAEFFEVDPDRKGLNTTHLEYLQNQPDFRPDLTRLEQLTVAAELTQQDYAESWAWVHFLLESAEDKQILADYLADLQQGVSTALSTELSNRFDQPALKLSSHLQSVRRAELTTSASPRR